MIADSALARRALVCALALATGSEILAAQPLSNGDFDTGIEGWTLNVPPPGDPSAVQMSWDPSLGFDALGSLRLEATEEMDGSGLAEAWSDCFPLDSQHPPLLSARVRRSPTASEGRCSAMLVQYTGEGCTGERTFGGGSGFPPEPGVWILNQSEGSSTGFFQSFRVGLVLVNMGDSLACNYDSVFLTQAGIAEVSDLGWRTRLLLAAGLLLGGLMVLRHSSP